MQFSLAQSGNHRFPARDLTLVFPASVPTAAGFNGLTVDEEK